MAEDKGYKPSKKKLRNARKEGRVLKNPIITFSFVFLAMIGGLIISASFTLISNEMLLEYTLTKGYHDLLLTSKLWMELGCKLLLIPFIAAVSVGIIVEGLQVGFFFEPEIVKAKLQRLEVFGGLKRVVESLRQAPFIVVKLFVIGLVLYWFLQGFVIELVIRSSGGIAIDVNFFRTWIIKFLLLVSLIFLVFGIVGFIAAHRKFFKELSMSRDELFREHKEDEGDPHVKAMRKSIHQEIMQETITKIRKAKVIIVEKNG